MLEPVTLDQLRVLIAIAETGSFSAAARRLKRAQSAVSHAVMALEQELYGRTIETKDRLAQLSQSRPMRQPEPRIS